MNGRFIRLCSEEAQGHLKMEIMTCTSMTTTRDLCLRTAVNMEPSGHQEDITQIRDETQKVRWKWFPWFLGGWERF